MRRRALPCLLAAVLLLAGTQVAGAWSWFSWLMPHSAVRHTDKKQVYKVVDDWGDTGSSVVVEGGVNEGAVDSGVSRLHVKVSLRQRNTARREAKLALLPHVRDCSFCHKCHLVQSHRDFVEERHILGGKRNAKGMNHPPIRKDSEAAKAYAKKVDARAKLPVCEECKGCTNMVNKLEAMNQNIKGHHLKPTQGMSRARVYRVSSSQSELGVAIGKVMCLPFWKDGKLEPCSTDFREWLDTKLYALAAAQQQVTEEFGFSSVVPKMWVENVTAIMPETGYVIMETMAMQEIARGGPLRAFHSALSTKLAISTLKKVNSTEVVLAAIYDLLFSQEDRHADNILIDDTPHISLIDDDKALRIYGGLPDSIFLPTTPLYEYQLWGRDWVRNRGLRPPKPHPGEFTMMLDYRCHVDKMPGFRPGSRRLGTKFPQQVKQCLGKIAGMTDKQVMKEYGFPTRELAKNLQVRASDLFTMGMEYTLHQGKPARSKCKSFPWRPPCCEWEHDPNINHEVCSDPKWRPEKWQKLNCKIDKDKVAHDVLPPPADWDPLKGLKMPRDDREV